MSAELVVDAEVISARDAHIIDADLRAAARAVDGAWTTVELLVAEAQAGDIHTQLGFPSWPAYVADVVAQEFPNISRQVDQRRRVIELLSDAGMSQRAIAQAVGVSKRTVQNDQEQVDRKYPPQSDRSVADKILDVLTDEESDQLAEELIAAEPRPVTGLDGKTYTPPAAPKPKPWSEDEAALRAMMEAGHAVTVSLRGHHERLIAWAEANGLYVRVDRRTDWGNPFEMGQDGDRGTVIANYRDHYLPNKPSLLSRLAELRGKALGCWCAPEPCHADVLTLFNMEDIA